MNHSSFATFTLSFQSIERNFSLSTSIPPSDFSKLLYSVFPSLESLAPSQIAFFPLDYKDHYLDIQAFLNQLPLLHHRSFEVVLNDFGEQFERNSIENRLFSSPQNPLTKSVGSHARVRSLMIGDDTNMNAKSPSLNRSSFGANHPSSLDRRFFAFLDKMLDEEKLEPREFFFLKCLFFEQRGFILDFVIESLRDQDFPKFSVILHKILDIKGFSESRRISAQKDLKVLGIVGRDFEPHEASILRELIIVNDSNVLAAISVFDQENDEEELVDTLSRILMRVKEGAKRQATTETNEENFTRNSKTMTEETNELPEKIHEMNVPEIIISGVESNNVSAISKKESMLGAIFRTLLEETEEEFEPYEIGMARYLFKLNDVSLGKILNTAETIEFAVASIKVLVREAFKSCLEKSFTKEEVDYVQSNKSERSNEVYSLLCSFKESGNLSDLIKDFRAVFEVKRGMEMFISGCSDQGKKELGEGKFSSVALLRSQKKKSSFKMLLMKEPTQQTVLKNSQNQIPMIVTINQTENQILKELLHSFHQNEQIGLEKIKKNGRLFDELVIKINLEKAKVVKLRALLDKNHFGMLKVLNLYEKFNGNIKKIKGELEKLFKRESVQDIDDVPSSPCLRNKIYKFNTFKQILHELMDRYQLISPKQQKLFLYLYLCEDLALLGSFETYLLTNSLQDFVENLRIIDKFHFFKTNLDFDEIEQFDENVEFQLSLLFAYKKYLKIEQKTSLEKIIRAGDQDLLKLYHEFQQHKEKDEFIRGFVELAESKTRDLKKLEQKMMESRMSGDKIAKNLDSLETFRQSKFLKNVKYYDIVEELVKDDHKLIKTAFEIYDMTKDKADFIENIELIYNLEYKRKYKEMIMRKEFLGRKLKKEELHFLNDCIELDIPNILAPYEIYMLTIHNLNEGAEEEESRLAFHEFTESIEISLRVYKKEIGLLEKTFYK